MADITGFRLARLGAASLVSFVAACSGAPWEVPSDEHGPRTEETPGTGPVDGEIRGSGSGSEASSGVGHSADGGASAAGAATPTGAAGSGPSSGSGGSGSPSSGSGGSGGTAGTGVGIAGSGGAGTAGAAGSSGEPPVRPGTLTAGAWDDNRNFERFLGYRAKLHGAQTPGLLGLSIDEHTASYEASTGWLVPHELVDVALVIDTTGSMGDEMSYLKTELIAISGKIASLYPSAQQRWSLIVYRDTGDEYLIRWRGFREGVEEIQKQLAEQTADGGGDYEEAPDAAFAKLNELYWRGASTVARLAFWVADAPHHALNAARFASALRRTRELGIHVYPVASSGVDELTELTMRSAAQITGGRYLFLTNDSGAGGAHKEPTIPCYFVTKLNDAIVRMVDIELSGVYHEPAPEQILRTGGDPRNGACVLESGTNVVAF